MKRLTGLIVLLYLPFFMNAQQFKSKDEKEVFDAMVKVGKAWTENNLDTLERYIGEGYQHTDVRGMLLDRASWLNYVRQRKEANVQNPLLDFDSVKIRVHNDIAMVTGINSFSGAAYADEKKKADAIRRMRFTQVLQKQNGTWKRMLFQATYIE